MISRGHHLAVRYHGQGLRSACNGNVRCASGKSNVIWPNRIRPTKSMIYSQVTLCPRGNQIERLPRGKSNFCMRPSHFSTFTKSEYIHPLSQIVLEHLQSSHSHWVQRMGLDTGLKLNKDGTFVLRFPCPDGEVVATDESVKGSSVDTPAINGSIWTMYEPDEKKHYLCVTKGSLVGRYMLQDNTKPAWHSDKRSTPERVQDAVDEMIEKLQEVGNSSAV